MDPAADLAVDARVGRIYAATYGPLYRDRVRFPDGQIHIVTRVSGPGALHVLDARTGTVVRTLAMPPATTAVAFDAERERIYVASGGPMTRDGQYAGLGIVTVLDARALATTRRVRIEGSPIALALNARARRLIVVLMDDRGSEHVSPTYVAVLDATRL